MRDLRYCDTIDLDYLLQLLSATEGQFGKSPTAHQSALA